jgi:two-component system, NtrC family, response regulator HydG
MRARRDDVPVLMLTGFATVDSAVQALKLGADDYITKPCDNELLRSKIRAVLARASRCSARERAASSPTPEMQQVLKAVARVAPTESTVLLRGATGTGKELVARAIHEESPAAAPVRRGQLLRARRGAARVGALRPRARRLHRRGGERKGLFEEANGGTLFLDEIGDVSPAMQARLLRVLQEREVTRVGTAKPFRSTCA